MSIKHNALMFAISNEFNSHAPLIQVIKTIVHVSDGEEMKNWLPYQRWNLNFGCQLRLNVKTPVLLSCRKIKFKN
jgi:hypothetical protein